MSKIYIPLKQTIKKPTYLTKLSEERQLKLNHGKDLSKEEKCQLYRWQANYLIEKDTRRVKIIDTLCKTIYPKSLIEQLKEDFKSCSLERG